MKSEDYIRLLRRRYNCQSDGEETSETLEAREAFESMLDEKSSATVYTVKYVKREDVGVDLQGIQININVTDTSKNDQKTNDEKYFNFKWDLNVQCGDQIYWDNTWWILYHREHNAVSSHKTFTVKQCNFDYTPEIKGKFYHFPVALVNLTLYSDGMADKVNMSSADGKRRMYFTNNGHTKDVGIGQRIMISNESVFEITHIDDFTRPGIKECVLSQVFRTSLDDVENNSAYNENSKVDEAEFDIIKGSKYMYIGGNEVYEVDYNLIDKSEAISWELISETDGIYIDRTSDFGENFDGVQYCRVVCINDIDLIDTDVTLILHTRNGDIEKEISVKGMF